MTLLLEGKTIGTRRAVSGVKPVITAAQRALAPRDVALERAAVEAYDELKGRFRDALFGALGRYRAEELTSRQLEQTWRASIREHWLQAYALGNRSEGYTAGLEDADRTWLKGAWGEEYRYLGKFVQALDNDALNMPADDRLEMYVETLDGMFHAGRVDALPENVRIHWRLGAVRTVHCKGCLQLSAEGPYDKPGSGGPNPLWTTPRAGDTPCITGCRCSLVVEEIPVEDVPPRERTVPIARPEVDERIPAGFRAPGPSERAYIENLMSRIAFSRLALQDLQGDAKRQEILVRHRLADELTKVLTANKLWVRPTWATGQAEVGESVSARALEELFNGRELTPAGLDVLHALDADRYQQLMDQYEARILSKLALQKMSPALAQRAEKIADLTALGLAGGAAAVLARRGREEPLALAADRRGEEDLEEVMQAGLPLGEDVTTSLNVAGAPGIGPGVEFKRARFLKGQKLKWQGLAWKVASVSFAPAPRRYVYVMVSETGQARIVSEAELDGVEVTGQLGREAQMVMDGSLPVGVFIERALQEGGSGSGHFGHKGRKKLRGGSLPGGSGLTASSEAIAERRAFAKGGFKPTIDVEDLRKARLYVLRGKPEHEQPIRTDQLATKLATRGLAQPGMREAMQEAGMRYWKEEAHQALWEVSKDMMTSWGATSSDGHPQSVALQLAAKQEFGLHYSVTSHIRMSVADENQRRRIPVYRKLLRAMYEQTQDELRAKKITMVPVFRGMRVGVGAGESYLGGRTKVVSARLQPLSSFSVSQHRAERFGSVLLTGSIPASRVLSTGRTGLGYLGESEVVVLGSRGRLTGYAQ